MRDGPDTGADEDADAIRTLAARGIVIGEATICALGQATRGVNLSAYVQRWSLVVDAPSDEAVLRGKRSAWLVAELRDASDYNAASRIANGVSATDVGDMLVQHASAINWQANSDTETPSVRSLLMEQVTSGALADIASDAAAIVRDAVDVILGPLMDFSGLNDRLAQGVSDTVTVPFTVSGNLPAPDLDAIPPCEVTDEAAGDAGPSNPDDCGRDDDDADGAADSVMARLMLSAAMDDMFAAGQTAERRRRQESQPAGSPTPAPTSAPIPGWCPERADDNKPVEQQILDKTLELLKSKPFEFEFDQGGCSSCALAADGNPTAGPCKQTRGPNTGRCSGFVVDETVCDAHAGHVTCASPTELSPQITFQWTLPGSFSFIFTWKAGWLGAGAGEFVFYTRVNMDPHMGYGGSGGLAVVKANLDQHGYGRFVDPPSAGIGSVAGGTTTAENSATAVAADLGLGVVSPAYYKALATAFARNFKYTFVRPVPPGATSRYGAPVTDLEFSAKYTATEVDRAGRVDLSAEIHLTLNNILGATSAPCHSFCDGMYYIYDWLNVATGNKHQDPLSSDPDVLRRNAENPWPLILARDHRWGGSAAGANVTDEQVAKQQLLRQYGVACPTASGDARPLTPQCDRQPPSYSPVTPNGAQSTDLETNFHESSYAVPGFSDRLESGLTTWNVRAAAIAWVAFLMESEMLKDLAYGTTFTQRGTSHSAVRLGFTHALAGAALELALCMRGRSCSRSNFEARTYCAAEIERVKAAGPDIHRAANSYDAYINGTSPTGTSSPPTGVCRGTHSAQCVINTVKEFWMAAQNVHQIAMVGASDKAQMLACLWFSRNNFRQNPETEMQVPLFSKETAALPTLPSRMHVFEAPLLPNLRTSGIGEMTIRAGADSECTTERGASTTGSAGYPFLFDLNVINQNAWDRTEPEWEDFGCGDSFTSYPIPVNGPEGSIPAGAPQLCADTDGVGLRKAWLNSIPRTDRQSARSPGRGRWAYQHCFAGEGSMPWSGVPGQPSDVTQDVAPKMRWLPLLDTMVRTGQFSGKHLELKSLIMDYPDQGSTFTQRDDEYIGVRTEVQSWPNSQGFPNNDGGIELERHWMHQRMWLRSALVTPGRAPTFQKRVNMDGVLPQTLQFANYWTGSGTTSEGIKQNLVDELTSSLQGTGGNVWDLSLRWKVGLSMKSIICMIMS